MPRSEVKFEPGEYYHVWTHAIGSENLFKTNENYRFFLSKYTSYINPVAKTYAYCLMPNHFHLMVQIKEIQSIGPSKAFSHLLNSYTQAFNKMFQRKGGLFVSNIRRRKIEDDSYFTRCITYIHQNPTHHGFIKDFRNWRYSSWKAIVSEKSTRIERIAVLDWFGGMAGFLKDHESRIGAEEEFIFGK
ncbi:MAG: transposase [Cyclobacteriaceae bacterium]|nr:transposase [Cyclobacteriaceae bacterium]